MESTSLLFRVEPKLVKTFLVQQKHYIYHFLDKWIYTTKMYKEKLIIRHHKIYDVKVGDYLWSTDFSIVVRFGSLWRLILFEFKHYSLGYY